MVTWGYRHKSAIVCTGVKEPQVHLAVFSTQMNLIELIVLGLLGLGANKEEGRFCGFLKSAEEPQSWLKHKTSLEENGKGCFPAGHGFRRTGWH